jgi:hypothetical protein
MSRMLTLIHDGWAAICSAAKSGRRTDALAGVTRLLARPDLPGSFAADANRLGGELLIETERFREARRRLRAAMALEPAHARTHYLLGVAHERDALGSDERAAVRFRKAMTLAPREALYAAAFGRAAVRCGRMKIGTRALIAAANSAPADLDVIRVSVAGLLEAGRHAAAGRVLTKASFACPGNRELTVLCERVRFAAARAGQRQSTRQRQDARTARDGGRVLIPFVRIAATAEPTPCGSVERRDVISMPRPHFPVRRAGRADR